MITLQANKSNLNSLNQELDKKVKGLKELTSPYMMTQYTNAIFTVTAKAFGKAMDIEARSNPKRYHHVYEWNRVGDKSARLFLLQKITSSAGVLNIKVVFRDSKTPVPVPDALRNPGKSGKFVTARSIFVKKAEIMEAGTPIIYRAKKPIPMADGERIKFIAAGTLIKNSHPGGTMVKNSFMKFYQGWYASRPNGILNSSGMLKAIENETVRILNQKGYGAEQVRQALTNTLQQYSMGATEE